MGNARRCPEIPRAFKTPLVPLRFLSLVLDLPVHDVFFYGYVDRLLVWMLIGMDIYLVYGAKHSHLGNGTDKGKDENSPVYRLGLCGLLVIAVYYINIP